MSITNIKLTNKIRHTSVGWYPVLMQYVLGKLSAKHLRKKVFVENECVIQTEIFSMNEYAACLDTSLSRMNNAL
jgi:hypothetical protein